MQAQLINQQQQVSGLMAGVMLSAKAEVGYQACDRSERYDAWHFSANRDSLEIGFGINATPIEMNPEVSGGSSTDSI